MPATSRRRRTWRRWSALRRAMRSDAGGPKGLGVNHRGVVGAAIWAGGNKIHTVRNAEIPAGRAGLVGVSVAPDDPVRARIDHHHPVAEVVVDGDISVRQ